MSNQSDLQLMLSDPDFAVKLNDFFDFLNADVEIYGGFFREHGTRWIKIASLPYSYRRIIAMLYALEKCDVVFIEAFDSGLHMLLLKHLIDYISNEYNKVIVAEVHHASSIVFGLNQRWVAYYIEKDKITKLEKPEDVKNTDVFFRELAEVKHP